MIPLRIIRRKNRFAKGQAVIVTLGGVAHSARVIENIDHVCSPLIDMWQIKVDAWSRPFGVSGEALVPANHA